MPLALAGCGTLVDAAAGVLGPGEVGGSADAHVVYRLRPDCPSLTARTLDNGYTVLTPRDVAEGAIETTGVFEGPVRTGEVVFRYVPPAESETWTAGPSDVVADVAAARLTQAEAAAALAEICGPEPTPAP